MKSALIFVYGLFWAGNCFFCHRTVFLTDIKPVNGELVQRDHWVDEHVTYLSPGIARCNWCKRELHKNLDAGKDIVEVRIE